MMDMITPYRNLFWFGVVFFFFGGTEWGEREEMCSFKLYFVHNLLLFALSRRDARGAHKGDIGMQNNQQEEVH